MRNEECAVACGQAAAPPGEGEHAARHLILSVTSAWRAGMLWQSEARCSIAAAGGSAVWFDQGRDEGVEPPHNDACSAELGCG